jgi:hypothetical protein
VGFVKPNEAWYAFNVTVITALGYPMEATFLSRKDWEIIMKPMLTIVLQRSRFVGTFPRDLLYSPMKFQGLGVLHPWYRQQIVHLITLCKETFQGSPTGELLTANAAQLRLEMGTPGSFTEARIPVVAEYMTTSWLKDLLQFLHFYHISTEDPLPKLLLKREGDPFLMEFFISGGLRGQELSFLNASGHLGNDSCRYLFGGQAVHSPMGMGRTLKPWESS